MGNISNNINLSRPSIRKCLHRHCDPTVGPLVPGQGERLCCGAFARLDAASVENGV